MEDLGALPYIQGGALLVLLMFLAWMLRAVARGDWVSRREVDYIRADRDARVAEKDREIDAWKAVGATERTGREVVTDQLRTAVAAVSTLDRFFDALRELAERDRHASPGTPPPPPGADARPR